MSNIHIATESEIKQGLLTDVYFKRTVSILRRKNLHKQVWAEVRVSSLPDDWEWAVFAGTEEVLWLLRDKPVDVWILQEGTVFLPEMPVMVILGDYIEYAELETAILGFICQASGIATKAARCKKAAGEKPVVSFGARRIHPAIVPMVERSAYIGGCDGVAVVKSAELIGQEPVGTMPHALVLVIGDTVDAVRAFNECIDPNVKRVALIDTFFDEKVEAIRVAEEMGEELYAMRLDTPASRRGNMVNILKEVRWELDYRGFNHIKLFVSGGLDEYSIHSMVKDADAFGVGTSISNAPVIDFSFDIVEIDGKPLAKRGKMSGVKHVFRCDSCFNTHVLPLKKDISQCECGGGFKPLLLKAVERGKVHYPFPSPSDIRNYVLEQLQYFDLSI